VREPIDDDEVCPWTALKDCDCSRCTLVASARDTAVSCRQHAGENLTASERDTRRHRVVFLTEGEAAILNGVRGPWPISFCGMTEVNRCCGHLEIFHRRGTLCTFCVICGHIENDAPPWESTTKVSWWRRLFR
jgi:hypothetical protein